jgi:hypothetical protein
MPLKKINIYGKHIYYMRNDSNKNRLLVSQITSALKENQWLKVSNQKYKPFKYDINEKKIGFKPKGSYYSKGGWLFHEMCCNLDNEIILIEVDYSNIYRITGKTPLTNTNTNNTYTKKINDFINEYGINNLFECTEKKKFGYLKSKKTNKVYCGSYYTKKSCIKNDHCKWDNTTTYFKYPYNKYDGLTVYPLPSYKWMHSKLLQRFMFITLDVETLALWNDKPVIKHHNLGTIREIVNEYKNKGKSGISKSSISKSRKILKKHITEDEIIDDVIPILIPALITLIEKKNEN